MSSNKIMMKAVKDEDVKPVETAAMAWDPMGTVIQDVKGDPKLEPGTLLEDFKSLIITGPSIDTEIMPETNEAVKNEDVKKEESEEGVYVSEVW